MLSLVRRKLSVSGSERGGIDQERYSEFRKQVITDLRPVLRNSDFNKFDFDSGWKIVEQLWIRLNEIQ
jgi:hypothetical protein